MNDNHLEELFLTEDDKETYTVEEYLWFDEEQAYLNVQGGIWSMQRFKEWHSVIVGQSVKSATEYLQTTIKMMEESNKNNCIGSCSMKSTCAKYNDCYIMTATLSIVRKYMSEKAEADTVSVITPESVQGMLSYMAQCSSADVVALGEALIFQCTPEQLIL